MDYLVELLTAAPVAASLKAYFFFPFLNEDRSVAVEMFVDEKLKKFDNPINTNRIRNILRWLEVSNFSEFVQKENDLRDILIDLAKLESKFLNFMTMPINEIPKSLAELNQIADLICKNEEYILQIARLRMVIDPEIQLSRNIHKKTNVLYMKVKGFWLNDEGKKERKYFKSLGKFDTYRNGIEDEIAILEGRKKIREVMYTDYVRIYGKD